MSDLINFTNQLNSDVKMATVLKKIIHDKISDVALKKTQKPLAEFKHLIKSDCRDFYNALTQNRPVFILECKKASPSKGLIRADFDLSAIAHVYKNHADVISVLTDEKYFQGNFAFLPTIKNQTSQPILCKDFIIDEYQIYLARYYKADAILLMFSVLNDEQYLHLQKIAHELNMGVLTEASNLEETKRAIKLGAKVIGINNRDLRDLSVDLNRVKTLSNIIPKDRIIISESGIYNHQQILELSQHAHGFLIGSSLMAEPNLELAVRKITLGENKICGLTQQDHAKAAYKAGAVYGGLIFVQASPRYISPANAKQLINSAALNWIGVFKNQPILEIAQIADDLHLYAVQLHGDENDQFIAELRRSLPENCQIWKALSIKSHIKAHQNESVSRYIFDHGEGGTGKSFDWDLLKNSLLNKVILAGGISTLNAEKAIKTGVIGLDINSGVESAPGIKDEHKIAEIFSILKNTSHIKE